MTQDIMESSKFHHLAANWNHSGTTQSHPSKAEADCSLLRFKALWSASSRHSVQCSSHYPHMTIEMEVN